MRKCVILILCVTILTFCLPVFSSATQTFYVDFPEPVPYASTSYFVLTYDIESRMNYLIMFSPMSSTDVHISFTASVKSDGYWEFKAYPFTDDHPEITVSYFSLFDGSYIGSRVISYNSSTFCYTFSTGWDHPSFQSFGVGLDSSVTQSGKYLSQIAWNDATDPSTYTTWLNQIYSKLGEIDLNTDGIESQLSSISSQLTLFYNLFNSYQMQQHTDLVNLYNKVIDIYNVLSEESETRAPAIENESEVQNVLQNEAALNKDFSGDLNQQFDVAGNIFEGNSAFSFISNLFQDLVLSVSQLNSLIIFSLAIGLCVLILGRRLNA